MAYNEKIAGRIREALSHLSDVKEQPKMGGLTFMLHDKFLIRVHNNELLCRVDHAKYEEVLEQKGCREWIYKAKPMKGWVMVKEEGFTSRKDFDYWIGLVLEFNERAKKAKKR